MSIMTEPFPITLGADLYRPPCNLTEEQLAQRRKEISEQPVKADRVTISQQGHYTVIELKKILDKLIADGHGDLSVCHELNEYDGFVNSITLDVDGDGLMFN